MVEVIKSGLFDSIQDLGRYGFQDLGVPCSGVMDRTSAQLANHILKNDLNAAMMEITAIGPTLRFHETTTITVTGADLNVKLNSESISMKAPMSIKKDDELIIGRLKNGCRAYLAIKGGFQTDIIMNSRSWYYPVTKFSRLQKGMLIPYKPLDSEDFTNDSFSTESISEFTNQQLEVYPGPEYDELSASLKEILESREFSIASTSNRMAYQFEELLPNSLSEIITSPVLPGTVQLTPSGRVIVLMRDGQVTGGYPRIFQLSEVSINVLSQKIFGCRVTFKRINK